MKTARFLTSRALHGQGLPECFAEATVAAAARAHESRALSAKPTRRRLARKVERLLLNPAIWQQLPSQQGGTTP